LTFAQPSSLLEFNKLVGTLLKPSTVLPSTQIRASSSVDRAKTGHAQFTPNLNKAQLGKSFDNDKMISQDLMLPPII